MAAFEEILQTLRGRRDTAFANAAASFIAVVKSLYVVKLLRC